MSDDRIPEVFGTPGRGAPVRYVGPLVGPAGSKLNATTTRLAQATTAFLAITHEVRSSRLLASEKASTIDEAAAKLSKTLASDNTTITAESDRISAARANASGVEPFNPVAGNPLPDVLTAIELAKRFHDLPPPERTKLLAEVTRDPAGHKTWAESLLRADPVLTGITSTERAALHEAALMTFKPELAAGLKAEAQQVLHARQALAIARDALRENAPGAWREMVGTDRTLAQS